MLDRPQRHRHGTGPEPALEASGMRHESSKLSSLEREHQSKLRLHRRLAEIGQEMQRLELGNRPPRSLRHEQNAGGR